MKVISYKIYKELCCSVNKICWLFPSVLIYISFFASPLPAQDTTNTSPSVKILKPENGIVLQAGKKVHFEGSAFDLEDGRVSSSNMYWRSDIDGYIGKGISIHCSTLSVGSHIITFAARDLKNLEDSDRIFITIKNRPSSKAGKKTKNYEPEELPHIPDKTVNGLSGTSCKSLNKSDGNDVESSSVANTIILVMYVAIEPGLAEETYNANNIRQLFSSLCQEKRVEYYVGVMLGTDKTENQNELNALLSISKQKIDCIKALIVGRDVLLQRTMSEDQLISYIRKVKQSTTIPVTTDQRWLLWLKYPRVAQEVDFLLVRVQPYLEGVAVEKAAEHVLEACKYIQAASPEKEIIAGEADWPSSGKIIGKAVPSAQNQLKFQQNFKQLLTDEKIEYLHSALSSPLTKKTQETKIKPTGSIH